MNLTRVFIRGTDTAKPIEYARVTGHHGQSDLDGLVGRLGDSFEVSCFATGSQRGVIDRKPAGAARARPAGGFLG